MDRGCGRLVPLVRGESSLCRGITPSRGITGRLVLDRLMRSTAVRIRKIRSGRRNRRLTRRTTSEAIFTNLVVKLSGVIVFLTLIVCQVK